MFDHSGKLLTLNGSKYDSFRQMSEIHALKNIQFKKDDDHQNAEEAHLDKIEE